jgi:amino acid transporter
MMSAPAARGGGLRSGSIGLPNVLFQAITHMAPAVSLTFVMLTAVSFAGPVLPLAIVLALIAILAVASSVGQLAKEIPSAGGLYAYAAEALGPRVGFVVGWAFLAIEPFVVPIVVLLAAFLLQDIFTNDVGVSTGWLVWALAAAAVIFLLAYRDVKMSTGATIVLGAIEIGVFVLLAVWIILSVGGDNTLAVFDPSNAAAGTGEGTFKGVVFAITALIGFESAAPLGEEAERPRWTVPRAIVLSALTIGVFYLLTSYAWVVGTGFDSFTDTTLASANPIRALSEDYWGLGWVLIFLAILNGVIANGIAGLNTGSRVTYAMGRAGALPRALSRVHPRLATPYVALRAQAAFGLALALVLGAIWDPLTGLAILGLCVGITVIVVYITICVATIVYFWRRRERFNLWLHGIVPGAGALFFLVPLYYQYRPLPDYPIRWANWFAPVWLALGIAVAVWLSRRRTGVLEGVQRDVDASAAEPVAP